MSQAEVGMRVSQRFKITPLLMIHHAQHIIWDAAQGGPLGGLLLRDTCVNKKEKKAALCNREKKTFNHEGLSHFSDFSISVENRNFSPSRAKGTAGAAAENSSGFGFNVRWERLRLLENKRDPIKI